MQIKRWQIFNSVGGQVRLQQFAQQGHMRLHQPHHDNAPKHESQTLTALAGNLMDPPLVKTFTGEYVA
jgi:hypothetical protein